MLRHSFLNDLVEKNKDLRYRIFKNDIEERGTTLTKFPKSFLYLGGKAVVDVGKIRHGFQVRAAQSKHYTACRLRQH